MYIFYYLKIFVLSKLYKRVKGLLQEKFGNHHFCICRCSLFTREFVEYSSLICTKNVRHIHTYSYTECIYNKFLLFSWTVWNENFLDVQIFLYGFSKYGYFLEGLNEVSRNKTVSIGSGEFVTYSPYSKGFIRV